MNDLIEKWCKGDEHAVSFILTLWEAAQVWDDIHDEGNTAKANDLFSWLAFGKEYHPFFAAHAQILRPAMLSMFLQWKAANALEAGGPRDIEKAYMLRAGFYGVIHLVTWLIAGDAWADECGLEIYQSYGETLEGLKEEIENA